MSGKKLTTIKKQEKYLEATAAIILPIVDSVRPLHSPKVWEDISPQFLVTFWSLCMYDLDVPNESYQREVMKLKKQSLTVLDSKEMVKLNAKTKPHRIFILLISRCGRMHQKVERNRNGTRR